MRRVGRSPPLPRRCCRWGLSPFRARGGWRRPGAAESGAPVRAAREKARTRRKQGAAHRRCGACVRTRVALAQGGKGLAAGLVTGTDRILSESRALYSAEYTWGLWTLNHVACAPITAPANANPSIRPGIPGVTSSGDERCTLLIYAAAPPHNITALRIVKLTSTAERFSSTCSVGQPLRKRDCHRPCQPARQETVRRFCRVLLRFDGK